MGRWVIALFILLVSMLTGLLIGSVNIPFEEVFSALRIFFGDSPGDDVMVSAAHQAILWELRLPRVILAATAGASMALAGLIMQASVQNPLAEPFLLGTASGASLGAVLAIFASSALGFSLEVLPFWAFGGAIGATLFVLFLGARDRSASAVRLVLAGAVISALFSAGSHLVIYLANDAEGMRSAAFWSMGSLAGARWDMLLLPVLTLLFMGVFFCFKVRQLNAMLLGEEAAMTLGVDLLKERRVYLLLVAFLTGVIVSACGIFGFVGLIVPHAVRAVVGTNHRYSLPAVMLGGGIFLVWADILSRILLTSGDLPIGILTALVGAPFFMYLLFQPNKGFGL